MICIPSGNHDMDRLARRLDREEMKIAFAFLLTMPGAPFIYYGDEIGLRYVEGLVSVEGGYGRTGSRSPMQWDDSLNAGFSTVAPERLYIAQDSAEDRPNVAAQMDDPDSLYNEVKRLIAFRQSHAALRNDGGIAFLQMGNYPLAYMRQSGEESLAVVINPSQECVVWECHADLGQALYHIGETLTRTDEGWSVPPCSAGIYQL